MSFQQIWAPWRLSYLQHSSEDSSQPQHASLALLPGADPKCFLCQGAVDPTNPSRYVVECNDLALTVANRFPYNNGHLLVAPRRHIGRLDQLTPEEHAALWHTIAKMVKLLERVLDPHGFNVGLNLGAAGGAGVPGHLHWHIVPRWHGDTNFMLTVAAVKVIPQALDQLREMLVNAIESSEQAQEGPNRSHEP